MKRNVLLGLILIVILPILFYLSLLTKILVQNSAIDYSSKNVTTKGKITLIVPKKTAIGNEIEIEVFYMPQLFEKKNLLNIMFVDSTGAYDIHTQLNFVIKIHNQLDSKYKLGLLPFYAKFNYRIPLQVCPQHIVYGTCAEVTTKKGIGKIRLAFDPDYSDFFGGEGYQGDGETVDVPIDIHY